jgi:hypothetical protein
MAHEMGHDLGLYHTFERAYNTRETVPRTGIQSNCTVAGDLLCDTHADPNPPASDISTNCVYTGTATDSLGYKYTPPVTNLMAYGRYECRDIFTTGQHSRMHGFITTYSPLVNAIASDNVSVISGGTLSSGIHAYGARNTLNVVPSSTFLMTGSAKAYFVAGNYIDLKPGVILQPGSVNGLSDIHINTMCK